ncbi:hypothetical protein, partial [Escherichia coli]|uniref:hypothetical protein n=1 Tax=Escherichia coli TaxID=562 RepID=UPI001BAF570E
SGGAFPFQPFADFPIVDERQTPRNAFPEAVLPSPSGHAKGCNDLSICSFFAECRYKKSPAFWARDVHS